jgi:peptidoglycan/LPS O-acetylase OafA/YrhL
MGTIAYGLYLLHFVFILAVGDVVYRFHPAQAGWLTLLVAIAGIALSIMAAAISWEYLEKPFVRRARRVATYS